MKSTRTAFSHKICFENTLRVADQVSSCGFNMHHLFYKCWKIAKGYKRILKCDVTIQMPNNFLNQLREVNKF